MNNWGGSEYIGGAQHFPDRQIVVSSGTAFRISDGLSSAYTAVLIKPNTIPAIINLLKFFIFISSLLLLNTKPCKLDLISIHTH